MSLAFGVLVGVQVGQEPLRHEVALTPAADSLVRAATAAGWATFALLAVLFPLLGGW